MQGESSILTGSINRLAKQNLFKKIPDEMLRSAITRVEEVHVLKGEIVFRKGERYHKGIYFVLSGQIELERPGTPLRVVCEEGPVGLSSFLGKTMYTVNAVALTDCSLLFVNELCVYRLMELSETFRTRLIREIQTRLTNLGNGVSTFLLWSSFRTVGSCMSSPVITLQTGKSVADAALLMKEHKIGSLLVVNRKQIVKGLVTSKHLVLRFLSEINENVSSLEIEKYMDTDPVVFPPEYPIVEALNDMQKTGATHALVMRDGKPAGIISASDISCMLLENASLYCAHIETLSSIEELSDVFVTIYKVAKAMAVSSRISRELLSALSSIHRTIQRKVFRIVSDKFKSDYNFALSDHTYCYLMLGSGARKEMDLLPYINNAIVLDDASDDKTVEMFNKFTELFNSSLEKVGYIPHVFDSKVTDGFFCRRAKHWLEAIDAWSGKDISEHNSCFPSIMDMTAFDGDVTLAWIIRNNMMKKISDKPSILVRFMEMDEEVKVPVSQFGGFIVEKDGPYKGMIDLKLQALHYLTKMTRLLSVYAGISDMGTVERIEHLARKKIITEEMASQAITAFDTIVETIINEQINQAQNNQPINNYLNPLSISLFYQEKLKRALHFLTIYTSYGVNLIKSL